MSATQGNYSGISAHGGNLRDDAIRESASRRVEP